MTAVKLTEVGDAVGLILPEALVARLRLKEGDTMLLTETPQGVKLTLHAPSTEANSVRTQPGD